jgi:hypothetical protein
MSEVSKIDPADIHEDDAVVTADGASLGHVIAFWPDMITPTHIVVEGGKLIHHDWYVPATAIAGYVPPANGDPGRVTLAATRDDVNANGWHEPPPGAPPAHELIGE